MEDQNTQYTTPNNFLYGIGLSPITSNEFIVPPEQIALNEAWARENFLNDLRAQRDVLLAQTDWTQLADVPLSDDLKQQYKVYRQALRDLPETATYDNLVWPEKPL